MTFGRATLHKKVFSPMYECTCYNSELDPQRATFMSLFFKTDSGRSHATLRAHGPKATIVGGWWWVGGGGGQIRTLGDRLDS
eukprot:SAG31_NODE_2150_length_6327_cov_4.325947_4_plen_82_part_00